MNRLQSLPAELFNDILCRSSLRDIGNLSLTGSVRLRETIIDWMKSASFQRTIVARLQVPGSWQEVTRDFGLLVRKVTVGQESSYRLRLLSDCWFGRLETLVSRDTLARRNQLWSQYLTRMGLATALAGLTKGWDVVEYNKILDWLKDTEDLGEFNRRLLRTYFWEFLDSDIERAKWTTWLLTTFTSLKLPVTYIGAKSWDISRLLMGIFGPSKIDVTEADLLHLSARQVESVRKSLGVTDWAGLYVFNPSWDNLQSQVEELARAVSSLGSKLPPQLMLSIVDTMLGSFVQGSINKGE